MKYYSAWIYTMNDNGTEVKSAIVYFAAKNRVEKNSFKEFGWNIVLLNRISPIKFAFYLLTQTVTNHIDCFDYAESVVIE